MSQPTGYVLGLIKDLKLNPFYLLRNVTDRTIYNITTLGMPGRLMGDLPDSTQRKILTASISSFDDYISTMQALATRYSIEDSYIVIDKFDMIADLARNTFLNTSPGMQEYQKLSNFEFNHYRDIILPLYRNGNRIILMTKPRKLYGPDGSDLNQLALSGLKRTDLWCHDICFMQATSPITLIMHYHRSMEYRPFLSEPTIEQIEEILINDNIIPDTDQPAEEP